MFAIYATHAAPDDPLSALEIGEKPEPAVREGWVRVKISHVRRRRISPPGCGRCDYPAMVRRTMLRCQAARSPKCALEVWHSRSIEQRRLAARAEDQA